MAYTVDVSFKTCIGVSTGGTVAQFDNAEEAINFALSRSAEKVGNVFFKNIYIYRGFTTVAVDGSKKANLSRKDMLGIYDVEQFIEIIQLTFRKDVNEKEYKLHIDQFESNSQRYCVA